MTDAANRATRRAAVTEYAGERHVVITRYLAGAPADVWAELAEPDGLALWCGADVAAGLTVEVSDPPVRFEGRTGAGRLWFELVPDEDVTVLTAGRVLAPGDDAPAIARAWDLLLDAFIAARPPR